MKIKIDGKEMTVSDVNKNIVEIGEENGLTILAPCFRNKKKHGCCNACVIEVDGQQKFACGTKPHDGMNIVYNRPDLDSIRKEKLAKYTEAIKNNDTSSNRCGGTDPTQVSSCGSGSNSSCGCS